MSVVSSSAPRQVPVQVAAPQPTPSQIRESVVEKSAKLIVADLDAIFGKEMDALADLHGAGSNLPQGTVTYPLRAATSASDVVPVNFLRPTVMVAENTSTTLESDVKGLTDPQATLYNAVLARSIHKITTVADIVMLGINLVRCEPEIRSGSSLDFNKSAILRSKVVAVALRAPSKVLAYFA